MMITFLEVDNVDTGKGQSQLIVNHVFITRKKNIEAQTMSQGIKENLEVNDLDVTCTNLVRVCIVPMTRSKQFTSTHVRTVIIHFSTLTKSKIAKIQVMSILVVIVPASSSHSKIGWTSLLGIKALSIVQRRRVAASSVITLSQDSDARVVKE